MASDQTQEQKQNLIEKFIRKYGSNPITMKMINQFCEKYGVEGEFYIETVTQLAFDGFKQEASSSANPPKKPKSQPVPESKNGIASLIGSSTGNKRIDEIILKRQNILQSKVSNNPPMDLDVMLPNGYKGIPTPQKTSNPRTWSEAERKAYARSLLEDTEETYTTPDEVISTSIMDLLPTATHHRGNAPINEADYINSLDEGIDVNPDAIEENFKKVAINKMAARWKKVDQLAAKKDREGPKLPGMNGGGDF